MSSVEPLPSKAQLDFEQLAVKLAVCVAPLVFETTAVTVTALPDRAQFSGSTIEPLTTGALASLTLSSSSCVPLLAASET